jgi:hypothetical protein
VDSKKEFNFASFKMRDFILINKQNTMNMKQVFTYLQPIRINELPVPAKVQDTCVIEQLKFGRFQ